MSFLHTVLLVDCANAIVEATVSVLEYRLFPNCKEVEPEMPWPMRVEYRRPHASQWQGASELMIGPVMH